MTIEEARDAYRVGLARQTRHTAKGTAHKWARMKADADRHMNGLAALAEATVADLLGLAWDQGDTPDKGVDVGENIGVRHTCLAHGSLIVHPEDRDDCVQVLVTGTTHPLTVVGWIPNRDAKRPEYWREKGVRFPAFFVPRKALRPISELFPSGIIPIPERTP